LEITLETLPSPEVLQLLEKLFKTWEDWDKNRAFYLNELLPELIAHPEAGTTQEKMILHELKKVATTEEWDQLIMIAINLPSKKKRIQEISKELDCFFDDNDFRAAEQYMCAYAGSGVHHIYEIKRTNAISRNWREITLALELFKFEKAELIYTTLFQLLTRTEIEEYKLVLQKKQKEYLLKLLGSYDFAKAEEVYLQLKEEYPEELYLKLVQEYKRKQERENLLFSIRGMLEVDHFSEADSQFRASNLVEEKEYLRMKTPYIQNYVLKHYSKPINIEKAEALANISPNLLLSARAGSGKTTVLACKTSMLIDCDQVRPDHILVLAFNRSAAAEIRTRIHDDYHQTDFENARTFHSLAHQIVQPTEELLFDEKDDIVTRKMTLLVQQLVKEKIHNPVFIEKMYEFFRKEMYEIERAGFLLDDETYFDFRRNLLQVTLNGEKVKSVGEKIIADFLFEHNISYGYEKVWLWGSQIYRPDFSIYEKQKDFVIEFWGIDENDSRKKVPPDWSQTWEDYIAEIQAKRKFWEEKSAVLIETSIRDLENGRETFEAILESRLAEAGINRPKMTSAELIKKVQGKDYTITRLSELFAQFIQRAKKKMLKASDVQTLMESYHPVNERESVFLDLACRIYMEYEQALIHQRKIDFDDLMMMAAKKVNKTKGECEIFLGKSKNRSLRMNDLEWILIDEYQDFSELFYQLITAIQKYNPRVKLLCVGDDWQAINGFAGSDLQYFTQFNEWVSDAQATYLLTNFRSQAAIVRTGNALMNGWGKPAEPLPDNIGGDVHFEYMDDERVEFSNKSVAACQKKEDERFLITETAADGTVKKYDHLVASKYLKKCYEIIKAPENRGKSVAILNRTNWIDGIRLNDFNDHLLTCFTQAEQVAMGDQKIKIDIQTTHKYKGLEADLVIIIGACDGVFPLLHPDNALFGIFGKTLMDAFDEERRLFYVALTRAKTSLYVLSEKGRESVFLKQLPGYLRSQSNYRWYARSTQYVLRSSENNYEDIQF
jgi:DNA helicase-4